MYQLRNEIYSVGVINPAMRVFDIMLKTEYGTSYNAFLINDKFPTLIETVHERFADAYFDKIKEICNITDVKYIIFNHTEPDHSGSLCRLLDVNPEITVVGSTASIKNLQKIVNRPFNEMIVKDGDTLNIGSRTLKFITAPNLHWPDSMFTYCESDKIVYTCDFLGAHYCEESFTNSNLVYNEKYQSAFEAYYNGIFAPFRRFVVAGLDKLEKLNFDMVCTSHGPILTQEIPKAIELYRQWSKPPEGTEKTAVIAYVSAYGYTKRLAIAAQEELVSAGYKVSLFNLESQQADMSEIMNADILMLGSPTINRDALKPIWDLISSFDAVNIISKRCGVFGSFGWSGEAVPMLCNRLKELKLKVSGDGYVVKFSPTQEEIFGMKEYVKTLT